MQVRRLRGVSCVLKKAEHTESDILSNKFKMLCLKLLKGILCMLHTPEKPHTSFITNVDDLTILYEKGNNAIRLRQVPNHSSDRKDIHWPKMFRELNSVRYCSLILSFSRNISHSVLWMENKFWRVDKWIFRWAQMTNITLKGTLWVPTNENAIEDLLKLFCLFLYDHSPKYARLGVAYAQAFWNPLEANLL